MGKGKGRAPCCDKTKVRSGPWSPAEDFCLITFIQKHGHPNWRALPKQSGLLRCGKSCRLRWINYLRPDVKRGNFTPQEEQTIINLHNSIGNKWSKIAASLPGRTDNEIKNVWNTFLKKRALSTTMMDYPNTESNDSTVDALASSSSTASSSLTTDAQIMEKLPCKDDDQVPVHGNQTMVSEHSESPDRTGSNNVSDHCSILQQDDMHTPEEELGFLELENSIPLQHESDVIDFWEFVDSMEMNELEEQQLACSKDDTTNNLSPGNYSSTSEVEFSKWLTNLEEELGLKSDGEHLTSGGLLPEICGDSDNQSCYNYCPELWPSSPLYFGI